jgi:hypothetical protein
MDNIIRDPIKRAHCTVCNNNLFFELPSSSFRFLGFGLQVLVSSLPENQDN